MGRPARRSCPLNAVFFLPVAVSGLGGYEEIMLGSRRQDPCLQQALESPALVPCVWGVDPDQIIEGSNPSCKPMWRSMYHQQ